MAKHTEVSLAVGDQVIHQNLAAWSRPYSPNWGTTWSSPFGPYALPGKLFYWNVKMHRALSIQAPGFDLRDQHSVFLGIAEKLELVHHEFHYEDVYLRSFGLLHVLESDGVNKVSNSPEFEWPTGLVLHELFVGAELKIDFVCLSLSGGYDEDDEETEDEKT